MLPYPSAGPPQEIDLGPVHPQDCEVCQCEQPFRLRLNYTYERMYVIFGNVRSKSYFLVCEECATPHRVSTADALKLGRLSREPIPFMHRYGCLLLAVMLVLVGIVTWLTAPPRQK